MEKSIHIGEIIKQKVQERNMSIADFADKICCDRTTVYDLFKRNSIDINRLLRVSEALDYNFIEEIYLPKKPKSKPTSPEEPALFLAIPIDPKELEKINLPEGALLLRKKQSLTRTI
ncbi:helix-turn-helix domain-containing protein [Parabacteroides sp.]